MVESNVSLATDSNFCTVREAHIKIWTFIITVEVECGSIICVLDIYLRGSCNKTVFFPLGKFLFCVMSFCEGRQKMLLSCEAGTSEMFLKCGEMLIIQNGNTLPSSWSCSLLRRGLYIDTVLCCRIIHLVPEFF